MPKNKGKRTSALITKQTSFTTIESYKVARTNLQFKLMNDNEKKCIVVTSADVGEGKTTTCINLATTFAQAGSRVLIVDADMRRPTIHRYLKLQSSPGLSDKICGFAEEDPCIYRTEQENLFAMPAGSIPPNPAELLMSNRMDAFLKVFMKNFDYVFVDAPPVGVVTDAAIIGAKCGGVLFVCRQYISRRDRIDEALKSLKQVGVNVYGFIFNGVSFEKNQRYYKRHYKGSNYSNNSYGYGYGYGAQKNDEPTEDD